MYPNAAQKPLILLAFGAFLRAKNAVFAFLYVVFFWLQAEKVVRMRRYAASNGKMRTYAKSNSQNRKAAGGTVLESPAALLYCAINWNLVKSLSKVNLSFFVAKTASSIKLMRYCSCCTRNQAYA